MNEIRSFPVLRDGKIIGDRIYREPECQDIDCPPVGSIVKNLHGTVCEVVSGPFVGYGGPSVTVRWPDGAVCAWSIANLTPIPETKTFRATYRGTDEADVRERFGLDGVELEEVEG